MEDPIMEPKEPEVLSARTDESTLIAMEELRALTSVMEALRTITNDEARGRILKAAATFFKVSFTQNDSRPMIQDESSHRMTLPVPTAFASERTVSPKEFLLEKHPQSDVERIACLAYYVTHYRGTPHFKTLDLSMLNTEAAQPKLSNAAMAVDNATKAHYLVPAAKGSKQLSANGELFVQALPDRDQAKAVMQSFRPKRKRKPVTGRIMPPVPEA